MGTYTDAIIPHNLDVSSGEALAKDLSNRFKVNVRFHFQSEYNNSMKLYHNNVEDEDFFIIAEIIFGENAPWYYLEDDNYFKKYVLENHGEDVFFKHFYKDYKEAEKQTIINKLRGSVYYYFYDVEDDKEFEGFTYYYFGISRSFVSISNFINVKWFYLCDSLTFEGLEWYDYFEKDRTDILEFCQIVGGNEVYLTADNGYGIEIPEEENLTWEQIKKNLRESAQDKIIEIPKLVEKKLIYLPIIKDDYPLLIYDNFKSSKPENLIFLNEKQTFSDYKKNYSTSYWKLYSIVKGDISKNLKNALILKNELESNLKNLACIATQKVQIYSLIAFVYYWNGEPEKAEKYHAFIFAESLYNDMYFIDSFRHSNTAFDLVENYLKLIFAHPNDDFIEKIKIKFSHIPKKFLKVFNEFKLYDTCNRLNYEKRKTTNYKENSIDEIYKKFWKPILGLSLNEKLMLSLSVSPINSKRAKKLINEGANINYFTKDKKNALTELIKCYWSKYRPNYPNDIVLLNQVYEVQFLINLGIDLNFIDGNGFNALYYSFKSLNHKVFELLIESGIDVNYVYPSNQTILSLINEELNKVHFKKRAPSAYYHLNKMKKIAEKHKGLYQNKNV